MLIGIGVICFLYGPFLTLLKDPPVRTTEEKHEAQEATVGHQSLVGVALEFASNPQLSI